MIENLGKSEVDSKLISHVVKSDWIQQVENILLNSQKAAKMIIEGKNNVFVYCAVGTSGTPLLCCLIQLFCDPYYRTF